MIQRHGNPAGRDRPAELGRETKGLSDHQTSNVEEDHHTAEEEGNKLQHGHVDESRARAEWCARDDLDHEQVDGTRTEQCDHKDRAVLPAQRLKQPCKFQPDRNAMMQEERDAAHASQQSTTNRVHDVECSFQIESELKHVATVIVKRDCRTRDNQQVMQNGCDMAREQTASNRVHVCVPGLRTQRHMNKAKCHLHHNPECHTQVDAIPHCRQEGLCFCVNAMQCDQCVFVN
mmetsp:Transcript_10381/g.31962  ORF Transcript_10381/g.31962 Transcript_10381/m.31962 type:complete len:232 (-) Transcript_10381:142-837(-)